MKRFTAPAVIVRMFLTFTVIGSFIYSLQMLWCLLNSNNVALFDNSATACVEAHKRLVPVTFLGLIRSKHYQINRFSVIPMKNEEEMRHPAIAAKQSTTDDMHTLENAVPLYKTHSRVLHIVTALAEYNNGDRNTYRGEDRLQSILIPVLKNSVLSMISDPYYFQVDVYLVLGWKLKPERRQLILNNLPDGVGIEIWDEATPIAYNKHKDKKVKCVTRGLARQHRFVIKDKTDHYDFFTVYEDDMFITGSQIGNFLDISRELRLLKNSAPNATDGKSEPRPTQKQKYYGVMTKAQLRRLIPGMIRVEVLLDEEHWPAQLKLGPIPVDHLMPRENVNMSIVEFDPKPCCHLLSGIGKLPTSSGVNQIIAWEAGIEGTMIRQLPPSGTGVLDWVVMQPGPNNLAKHEFIGGYWAGRDGAYGDERQPRAGDPRFIAQGGGWMFTTEQLVDLHMNHCPGGFIPPYDSKYFRGEDGLIFLNVEFWSGGYSVFGGGNGACKMQRILSLNPEQVSKHFIYHISNNKQKQMNPSGQNRLVKVNDMIGQIIAVVKNARKGIR